MAYVINDNCVACGSCISECPVEAISEGDIYQVAFLIQYKIRRGRLEF